MCISGEAHQQHHLGVLNVNCSSSVMKRRRVCFNNKVFEFSQTVTVMKEVEDIASLIVSRSEAKYYILKFHLKTKMCQSY